MHKWIYVLGAMFLGQLGLIAAFNLNTTEHQAFEAQEVLLAFSTDGVDQIDIDDGEAQVKLAKVSGQWQLPELHGFPADSGRVEQLLTRLADLRRGWPIATTGASATRFNLGDEGYERKITLRQGEREVPALLVGTSPGFRKVHVRRAGEDEVYSVAFNAYEAGAGEDDWIDRTILAVDQTQVAGVRWPSFSLLREEETFQLQGLNEGQSMDEEQVQSLVRKLSELRIQSVAKGEASDTGSQANIVQIELTKTDDEALQYKFVKPSPEATHYLVERSDLPYRFTVAEFDAKPLVEATLAELVSSDAGNGEEQPTAEVSDASESPGEEGGGT